MLFAVGVTGVARGSSGFANEMLPAGCYQLPFRKQVAEGKYLKTFGCPPGIRTPIC
jgi:hypothetical protein